MKTKKMVILSLIMIFAIVTQTISAEAGKPSEEYLNYIDGVCETYDVSPELVQALIFYESSWCTAATSPSGNHIGLMQISPSAHKERMKRLGCKDLTNGYQNIIVGVDYLAELFEEYNDPPQVLDIYNGQKHSNEWYEAGNMSKYSEKILKLAEELEDKE